MIVSKLVISNFRAISQAEFEFQPGFNLIAGVNGVGKTTVLDALRIIFSRLLPNIVESRTRSQSLKAQDIRSGTDSCILALTVKMGSNEFDFRNELSVNGHSEDTLNPQSLALWKESTEKLKNSPLCVFFGARRSTIQATRPQKGNVVGGTAVAYTNALRHRRWNISELAAWLKVQVVLEGESSVAAQHINVLQNAASRFLPGCSNLRTDDDEDGILLLDKDGTTLSVQQFSDGERGILSMVLDLARRLSQANPKERDPLASGKAIVLIDELELHLHPKWQREIVHRLQETFPRCQFIATTHSPQVIGEVPSERIQIIANGQVYSPTHSFGVDSSRVLEEIMHADPRTAEVGQLLSDVSQAIGKERYGKAREILSLLVDRLGEDDPEVTRITTLLILMEEELDETDRQKD